jgi:hypothetical protein
MLQEALRKHLKLNVPIFEKMFNANKQTKNLNYTFIANLPFLKKLPIFGVFIGKSNFNFILGFKAIQFIYFSEYLVFIQT